MTLTAKRRWYQFSLRTMFVLVVVVSIPLAWVGYSLDWIKQRQHALDRHVNGGSWSVDDRWNAPGLLGLFGENGFSIMECRKNSSPEIVEQVRRLFPEAWVLTEEEFERLVELNAPPPIQPGG